MLLAAGRGYEGCELLAFPNLILGRRDAIWCPIYTPIDRTEVDPDDRTTDARLVSFWPRPGD